MTNYRIQPTEDIVAGERTHHVVDAADTVFFKGTALECATYINRHPEAATAPEKPANGTQVYYNGAAYMVIAQCGIQIRIRSVLYPKIVRTVCRGQVRS